MAKNSTPKKRAWTFILYPESAPEDWQECLKQSGLKIAVSPLHCDDVNADGETKKEHRHIIAVYDGPTTYANVAKFTHSLNCTIPQPLEQVRGMYRYFTHEDNPEKAQYDKADILTFNGFNIRDFVEMTTSEKEQIKRRLLDFVRQNEIVEYSTFMERVMDELDEDSFSVASTNTVFFNSFISSLRNKLRGRFLRVDKETGEVRDD